MNLLSGVRNDIEYDTRILFLVNVVLTTTLQCTQIIRRGHATCRKRPHRQLAPDDGRDPRVCTPLPRPCNSELTAWTRTPILQTSIRDPGRFRPPASDYYRDQHSNDRSPQHHARYQQPPGHDQVKTTERHHHCRSPDRCLSRSAAGLHEIVKSRQFVTLIFIRSTVDSSHLFVHTLMTYVYVLAILLVWPPMFAAM